MLHISKLAKMIMKKAIAALVSLIVASGAIGCQDGAVPDNERSSTKSEERPQQRVPDTGSRAAHTAKHEDMEEPTVGLRNDMLPIGFANIRLGMTLDELKQARSVQKLNAVSGKTDLVFHESNLSNPFYENAMFGIPQETEKLQWLVLTIEASGKELSQRLNGFLAGVVAKWGEDYEVVFSRMRHSKREYVGPTLVWRKPGINIFASYTPLKLMDDQKKAAFYLRFVDSDFDIERHLDIVKRLEDEHSLNEFKTSLRSGLSKAAVKFK